MIWHPPPLNEGRCKKAEQMSVTQTRPAIGSIMVFLAGIHLGRLFHLCGCARRLWGVSSGADPRRSRSAWCTSATSLKLALAEMENLTKRLSDEYLDLDLLDQQARDVLGYLRADEIVIR